MSYDENDHGSRIHQLERDNAEVGSQLTGMNVTLTYMGKAIEGIGTKIDTMMTPITIRLNEFEERVGEHSAVLGDLSRTDKVRRGRTIAAKKVFLGVIVAIAGIVGKETFMWIWHLVTKAV